MNKFTSVILCATFLFSLATEVKSQSAYYDALILRSQLNEDGEIDKGSDTAMTVLFGYLPDSLKQKYTAPSGGIITDSVASYYRSVNKFIIISGSAQSPLSAILQIFSSFSNADPTVIADGIGKFLAKRSRDELNVLFFDRFREFLNTHPEIARLFPSTTILLNAILNYEYSNLLSTLRAAFDSDLKGLLRNLALVAEIDSSACNKCIPSKKAQCVERLGVIKSFFNSNRGRALIAGLLIADGAVTKANPADILSSIAGNTHIQGASPDLYGSLQIVHVFSESLRTDQPGRAWISTAELNTLITDTLTLKMFLGLVYQQMLNDKVMIGGNNFAEKFITPANVSGLRSYITSTVNAGKKLEESLNKLKEAEEDTSNKETLQRAGQFVSAFRGFFNSAIQYHTINSAIPRPGANTRLIFTYVDTSLGIVQKLLAKEYYGALLSVTILLENIFQTREDFNSDGQLLSSNVDQQAALTKKQFMRSLLRYGNFAANVVEAENSEQVSEAIEAIALPPGSASIKRTTNFNIALQAYTGLVSGNIKDEKGFWNSVSAYAPVGIGISIGLRPGFRPRFTGVQNPQNKKTWGSLTAFASIIDVGAVVAYRFYHPDEKISDSVKVSWSNILAPGINLVYGIPKWPLSIGFGGQYQASLAKFDAASATIVERSGVRYNLFIALDIPVINLYTSKR